MERWREREKEKERNELDKACFTLDAAYTKYGFSAESYFQKQSSKGVLKKMCSENMQQIYRRTPTPKCNL